LALGAVPLTAYASGSSRAADACIQAFIDTYLPKDTPVQVRKLPPPSQGVLGSFSKRHTIELSARATRSGTELVTAKCVANADGEVIKIDSATFVTTLTTATSN
jgi:hypothetical protein